MRRRHNSNANARTTDNQVLPKAVIRTVILAWALRVRQPATDSRAQRDTVGRRPSRNAWGKRLPARVLTIT